MSLRLYVSRCIVYCAGRVRFACDVCGLLVVVGVCWVGMGALV